MAKDKTAVAKRTTHGRTKKILDRATLSASVPTQRVVFTATTKGTVASYTVDAAMVRVLPGSGTVDVPVGIKQPLAWQFAGMPGDSLSIAGKVGEQTVVEVTDSTVPPASHHGGGFKYFTVK